MSRSAERRPLTIGLVSNQTSVHVQRWATGLGDRGHLVIPIDLSGRRRSATRRVAAYAGLRRQIARVAGGADSIVAVHFPPRGILATGLRGVHPMVLSAWGHDVTLEESSFMGRTRAVQQRGLFRAADAVTVTSEFLADVVRSRFDVASTVVPFGVDVERFRPRPGPRRPGPVRIGFLKLGLEAKYGPDVLVEALGRIPADMPFEAVFTGEGSLGDRLRDRVTELGIADRVRFIGRRSHDEVVEILADLDILAMPSRREEWGVAAAEASSSGLPVVATSVGGIPEIVLDGMTGLLVAPEDPAALAVALARCIGDSDLRGRLGAEGRRRIDAEFRWDRCVDRMEDVFYSVLARRNGRSRRP